MVSNDIMISFLLWIAGFLRRYIYATSVFYYYTNASKINFWFIADFFSGKCIIYGDPVTNCSQNFPIKVFLAHV